VVCVSIELCVHVFTELEEVISVFSGWKLIQKLEFKH
jgi:hypothetical protein